MNNIAGRKTKPAVVWKKIPVETANTRINTSPTTSLPATHYPEYHGSRKERRKK